jgi:error-prone DNA polymerase
MAFMAERAAIAYAELHCLSSFSFLRAASSPEELVRQAWILGYEALAITDECSVAGTVRAWKVLKTYTQGGQAPTPRRRPLKLLYGSEFCYEGYTLVALARDREGWGRLCQAITAARREAPKGSYRLPPLSELICALAGCELLVAPQARAPDALAVLSAVTAALPAVTADRPALTLLAECPCGWDDADWIERLRRFAIARGWPLALAGGVCMHARHRQRLLDVMTAIRLGRPLAECGFALAAHGERHLRPRRVIAARHPPDLRAQTLRVAARCEFVLDQIAYNYPLEPLIPGLTASQTLRRLTQEGARERYPQGVPPPITAFIEKELQLIADCRYEMFFLTVHDVVREARRRGILCQGRGSAANSVVCYCLGITAANPEESHPLLERFISKSRRDDPPDIDVDFEHERREEIIQYLYAKYGHDRAALAATLICYRTKSAIRDVGKALGVSDVLIDAFAKDHPWFEKGLNPAQLNDLAHEQGITLEPALAHHWLRMARELRGHPRHLSQHVGGFVLTQEPLTCLVPVEPASMENRRVIQWDKDDLEALGLMKVDVLALGMLTAVRRCLDLISQRRGHPFTRYDITRDDPATYAMIRRADTVGTFQIESRAQMSMLPRLRPARFYDLVVQVAIVRPGPITGGMVHPYLQARERERQGLPVVYENPALSEALERTLGVPIFQEQVMQIAMIAAGFSAEQADGLRRAMAAWKRGGHVHAYEQKLRDGMLERGYTEDFACRIFQQILGFGEYGFPESHAYSFALIAYESAWLKCHEPAAFLAALLNSQPMGFYAPAQLIQDARRHGVTVLPADVSHSDHLCTLEGSPAEESPGAVRLGLCLVDGFGQAAAQRVEQARAQAAFADLADLAQRATLDVKEMRALAAAGALASLAGHRRQQVWESSPLRPMPHLLASAAPGEARLALPEAPEGEAITLDYAALGFTLRRHPLALLRTRLAARRVRTAAELAELAHGEPATACGLVIGRQQPGTAKGTIFVTLEDETGCVNVIVWPGLRTDKTQRNALLRARLLVVRGQWQRDEDSGGQVRHLVARRLHDLTPLLGNLGEWTRSRDFH